MPDPVVHAFYTLSHLLPTKKKTYEARNIVFTFQPDAGNSSCWSWDLECRWWARRAGPTARRTESHLCPSLFPYSAVRWPAGCLRRSHLFSVCHLQIQKVWEAARSQIGPLIHLTRNYWVPSLCQVQRRAPRWGREHRWLSSRGAWGWNDLSVGTWGLSRCPRIEKKLDPTSWTRRGKSVTHCLVTWAQ